MGRIRSPALFWILFICIVSIHIPGHSGRVDSSEAFTLHGRTDSTISQVETAGDSGKLSIEETTIRLGKGELREPLGLAVDARGYIFVADAMTGKVFRYSRSGESIEFEKPSRLTSLYPIDLAVHGSFVYVLDYDGNNLLRFDHKGSYIDVLLAFKRFDRMHPASLSASEGGRLVTTDVNVHSVTVWTPLLDVELTIGEYGWAVGKVDRPVKAVILPDDRIAVVDAGNKRVQIFSPAGRFERILSLKEGEEFVSPRSIAADRSGNMLVADPGAGKILCFTSEGDFFLELKSFSGENIKPAAIAIGWDDFVYVADVNSHTILVYRLQYPS